MAVKVTFLFDPEPEEADDDDSTGLSEEGYNELSDAVSALGGYDVKFEGGH